MCTPAELGTIIRLIKKVVWLICIAVPIILILMASLDMAKVVIAGEEKEVTAAQKLLIKRFIYAVVVFLIPIIVGFVMNFVAEIAPNSGATAWKACWNERTNIR